MPDVKLDMIDVDVIHGFVFLGLFMRVFLHGRFDTLEVPRYIFNCIPEVR